MILIYVLTSFLLLTSGIKSNVLQQVGEKITDGVAAITTPIESAVLTAASNQCSKVKELLGLSYTELEEKDPDVNLLTLDYISSAMNITYNITTAGTYVPLTTGFDPNEMLVIFIHGYTDNPTTNTFTTVHDAFKSIGIHNVLALDASSMIQKFYLRSSTYVTFIGERLGETLVDMVNNGVCRSNIYVIGHSLGAQIAGFTGKTFYNLTGQLLPRITGLDPAGPCFTNVDNDDRLSPTDAEFVDVIHTDAGVLGLNRDLGQVDYYPNGGSIQPDCSDPSCSHSRSWEYFSESVKNPDAFLAVKCKDWDSFKKGDCEDDVSSMGYASQPGTTGRYFLRTSGEEPYGLGVKGESEKE